MPYINLKTTEKISKEKEDTLAKEFGRLIELLPGKSDEWLMSEFSGERRISFRYENSPAAMIEISVFGKCRAEDYNRLTAALTETVSRELSIRTDRIYVKYTECEHWGYDGENF